MVFKRKRIRLSLGLPCAILEAGRQWTGTSRLLKEEGMHAVLLIPSQDVTHRHCKRKTFQTFKDIKHILSIKWVLRKYPVKFSN